VARIGHEDSEMGLEAEVPLFSPPSQTAISRSLDPTAAGERRGLEHGSAQEMFH
jgi:hypothetical protein